MKKKRRKRSLEKKRDRSLVRKNSGGSVKKRRSLVKQKLTTMNVRSRLMIPR